MKKIMGTLACGFLLLMGATHANAAFLTDWNYTLSGVGIHDVAYGNEYEYESSYTGALVKGVTYYSGDYAHTVQSNVSTSTSGSSTITDGISSIGNDRVIRYDTSMKNSTVSTNGEKITDLSFTYTMTSGNVSMNVQFTLPLYTYYDAVSETSYVYYNTNEVSMMGKSSVIHDNYLYVALGFNLTVDGRALSEYTSTDGTVYKGWATNEDTRKNYYDDYVVGGTNTSTGVKKDWGGGYYEFFINSSVSMASFSLGTSMPTQYEAALKAAMNPMPAPTPEPATMLLMGLGLLGLGAVARRRK